MRPVSWIDGHLLSMGIITALVIVYVSSLYTGLFYLAILYIPFLPWTSEMREPRIIRYASINILGLFLNPLTYYFLNMIGVPIDVNTIYGTAITFFSLGLVIYMRKRT